MYTRSHNKKIIFFSIQINKNENENTKKYCIKAQYEKSVD